MQQRQRNEMKIAHCTRERGNCSVINRRRRSEEIDAHLIEQADDDGEIENGEGFPSPFLVWEGIVWGHSRSRDREVPE